ncbi:MAG: hypothetical protein FWE65_00620 [Eggerthellaceae bacterium]|nr:hypothetical protein [Eggerthellaceae bacterium]
MLALVVFTVLGLSLFSNPLHADVSNPLNEGQNSGSEMAETPLAEKPDNTETPEASALEAAEFDSALNEAPPGLISSEKPEGQTEGLAEESEAEAANGEETPEGASSEGRAEEATGEESEESEESETDNSTTEEASTLLPEITGELNTGGTSGSSAAQESNALGIGVFVTEKLDETFGKETTETPQTTPGATSPAKPNEGKREIVGKYDIAATIDLSAECKTESFTGNGYKIEGGPWPTYSPGSLVEAPKGTLNFNTTANGKSYRIVQSGTPTKPDPKGHKYGSSWIQNINIPDGVDTTLIVSDIHLLGSIQVFGNGKLALVLDQTSYIRGRIDVPAGTRLTISSLNGNDTSDGLVMPLRPGSSTHYADARIGGSGYSNSGGNIRNGVSAGTINIEGGKIDITSCSAGACIGGGGGFGNTLQNSYSGGNGGTISISGGDITVMQNARPVTTESETHIDIAGACIGGGGGENMNGGNGGRILISGGKLTVVQYAGGAGIGGGQQGAAGSITINGGTLDVRVTGVPAYASISGSGAGAGIGTGTGNHAQETGSITINGGEVHVTADYTAIGKIHNSTVGNSGHEIIITGGNVYAKGSMGPGIGFFAVPLDSKISILGGTVCAESDFRPAIGAALSPAAFVLDAAATLEAYSGSSSNPAINATDNAGSGYFVNASFSAAVSKTSATTLQVYAESAPGTQIKTLSLPASYRHFAYSTQTTAPRSDNIYLSNNGNITHAVVRSEDSSQQIYAVKTRAGYDSHNKTGAAPQGALPVKLAALYTITEKYFDISGTTLGPDTYSYVFQGQNYSKDIPTREGYSALGYCFGSYAPTSYTQAGSVSIRPVSGNQVVSFVYRNYQVLYLPNGGEGPNYLQNSAGSETSTMKFEKTGFKAPVGMQFAGWNTKANGMGTGYAEEEALSLKDNLELYAQWTPVLLSLNISKSVAGGLADKTKEFRFTLSLADKEGRPLAKGTLISYTGDTLPGSTAEAPRPGLLRLDEGGKASFTLSHGQLVSLQGLPYGTQLRIEEDPAGYIASFYDSEKSGLSEQGSDTKTDSAAMREMTQDRSFDFVNRREKVVPSGIAYSDTTPAFHLPLLALLAVLLWASHRAALHRRSLSRKKAAFAAATTRRCL